MSRVYEALRQSELEQGVAPTLLDPDTFLAAQPTQMPVVEHAEPDGLDWGSIIELEPRVRTDSRVVTLTDDDGLGAEKFRLLRARVRNLRETQQMRRLVVTSAMPEEGKTLISMNLAVCLAKHTTQRILLLEGDLRKPMLGEHLGLGSLPGIGDWAVVQEPISKFIYRFDKLQLWILAAGCAHENPVAILQSARFLELYRYLSKCFDWILIDAPPMLPMADVNFWSRHADGLLLVVRDGSTPKSLLAKGLESLDNPKIAGVVLNDARDVESGYYSHYYHHYGRKKSAQ
jgi:capsular exopolysaccharide synthesis family protein